MLQSMSQDLIGLDGLLVETQALSGHSSWAQQNIIRQVQVTLELSGSSPLQMSMEDLFGWEERNAKCTTVVWTSFQLNLAVVAFVSWLKSQKLTGTPDEVLYSTPRRA